MKIVMIFWDVYVIETLWYRGWLNFTFTNKYFIKKIPMTPQKDKNIDIIYTTNVYNYSYTKGD